MKVRAVVAGWLLVSLAGLSAQDAPPATDSLTLSGFDLQARSDSLHRADSLERERLQSRLDALSPGEARRRGELEARLDSLERIEAARNDSVRAQVEALRADHVGSPVLLDDDTVLVVHAHLGPFGPAERAANTSGRLELLVEEGRFDAGKLFVRHGVETDDVMHGEVVLLSVTQRDAFWERKDRRAVAEEYRNAIATVVEARLARTDPLQMVKRIGLLLLVILLFGLLIRYLNRGMTWAGDRLFRWGRRMLSHTALGGRSFAFSSVIDRIVNWLVGVIKWVLILVIVYLVLPIAFSIFPATEGIARTLIGYVLDPLKDFGHALIAYVPELITVLVIVLIARSFVRFLRFVGGEVESGRIELPGFYREWAMPTFNLLRVIVYAFAFILVFPYLPGSDSPAFRGVSVFFGLLISLGSSSAISNLIAGLVITYMRAFWVGDRVRIGDATGDVIEKNLLVTRLRTVKNEDVTIPNSAILNGSTVNYSSGAKERGLILNSTVTIGYDVPWRKVHELLIAAAEGTTDVLKDPKPFVLQTSLDDFYVSYQINAYTQEAGKQSAMYSELHARILDAFQAAGVEIMSPHYRAERDGNAPAIPQEAPTPHAP